MPHRTLAALFAGLLCERYGLRNLSSRFEDSENPKKTGDYQCNTCDGGKTWWELEHGLDYNLRLTTLQKT